MWGSTTLRSQGYARNLLVVNRARETIFESRRTMVVNSKRPATSLG